MGVLVFYTVFTRCIFIFFFLLQVAYGQNIDSLLDRLARKDDLSVHTKKETAGYLTIFTRQDLDRMKIKSLSELIEKIPFVRYNEDSLGLSDPYYQPYQKNNPARIRVYIDDRELLSPLFGSGFQLFAQVDMAYIDHIEVYMGLPSYEISLEPAVVVIKAYTKTGKRENTSVVGVSGGTYGTEDVYGYSSKDLQDYSYFVYADYRNLKREKLYNRGSKLSRDKMSNNFYAQIIKPNSKFYFQAIKGSMDNFIGSSWDMTPRNLSTDFTNLFSGYSYNSTDKSLQASINYSYLASDYFDSSYSPLGLNPIPFPPYYAPYFSNSVKTKEHLLDAKIAKKIKAGDFSLLFGLRNRYKQFDVKSKKDSFIFKNDTYNHEDVASVFTEMDYLFNQKNRFILSLSAERYFEDGRVKSDNIYGIRVGHIYHAGDFTQKSFLFYGKFRPTPYMLLGNDSLPIPQDNLDSEEAYAISTKSIWKNKNMTTSLLFSNISDKNSIYYDLSSFKNSNSRFVFNSISFRNIYMLNDIDKIDFNAWVVFEDYGANSSDRYINKYGGYIALFKKIGKIDTYNSLSYRDGYRDLSAGWNYSTTLTYPYSKNLSFYLKGENLFKDALKTNYYRVNLITHQTTYLNDISVFDRRVWLGLEYQF